MRADTAQYTPKSDKFYYTGPGKEKFKKNQEEKLMIRKKRKNLSAPFQISSKVVGRDKMSECCVCSGRAC